MCAMLLGVAAVLTGYGCKGNGFSPQSFPVTGQTTVYAARDDGAIKAGAALSYADNGDGTITDNNTKLMWEKKDQASGGLHNWANVYSWSGLCSVLTTKSCGTDADFGVSGGACKAKGPMTIFQWVAQLNMGAGFAGHTDWRVPNVKELESIVNYQNFNPAAGAAFNASCSLGCTVATCSCTQSGDYWSATTFVGSPGYAWGVYFADGDVFDYNKTYEFYLRAVRSDS
jgi:hypothetical protein